MSQITISSSDLIIHFLDIDLESIEFLLLEDFESEEEEKELDNEENKKLKKERESLRFLDSTLKINSQNTSLNTLQDSYLKEVFTPPPELVCTN